MPAKMTLIKNMALQCIIKHSIKITELVIRLIKPSFKQRCIFRVLAEIWTNNDANKIPVMVAPLTNGPCHGIISRINEGASEANKLKVEKAENAAKLAT